MYNLLDLISTFVGAVTLIMALVLMVSILKRVGQNWVQGPIWMGILHGLSVILAMSDPIDLGAAGIFDMRGLLIGTAAALFGPVVGMMTLLAGIAMRLGIGGPGVIAGLVGMGVAFGAGVLWRYTVRETALATWKKSVSLGGMITFQMVAIFFTPVDLRGALFETLLPFTLVTNVLGALLINHLMSGELSFLSSAETTRREANTDHLTGLLNRRGFELVYPAIGKGDTSARGLGLIYFDIDHFKTINDTHGHGVGNDVLKYVSDQIAANLRPNDIFARLGGDEFVVLLRNIDAGEAQHIAQRCRNVITNSAFQYDGQLIHVTISIGAVWMLNHGEMDNVLNEADDALYAAKTAGRNRVVFTSRKDHQIAGSLGLPA